MKVNQASAQSENLGSDHFELERIYLRQKFQHQGLEKFYAKNGFKCFSQHTYQVGNDPQIDYLLEENYN